MRTLLPIRTSGSKLPLFCIHGEPMKMARCVDSDRPVYGIYSAYDPEFEPPDSLPELAALYLREVRLVQPRGPYFLAGYCVGGLAAFEMARQLVAAGERVAYLALIDPTDPGQRFTRREWIAQSFAVPGQRLSAARFFVHRAWLSLRSRTHTLYRLLKSYVLPLFGRELPVDLRQIRALGRIRRSFDDYRYTPIDLPGVVFKPEMDAERRASTEDYWAGIFQGGVELVTLPGLTRHPQFMTEPFHTIVAQTIDRQLGEARSA